VPEWVFFLDEQLALWENHWSEQVAKQAVWLSGLVPFVQVEQIMREVGRIDISQSSVWRRVERWGSRFQAVENLQQAKAYGFEEPESLDRNRLLRRMGAAMDGTMVHIREEGWKELKVGCVFDITTRRQFDPHTREEVELGSATNNSYVAHLGGPDVFGRQLWVKLDNVFGCMLKTTLRLGMVLHGFGTWWTNIFIPVTNWWIGIMPQNILPTQPRPCMVKAALLLSVGIGAGKPNSIKATWTNWCRP
jgi:hypothetical protein